MLSGIVPFAFSARLGPWQTSGVSLQMKRIILPVFIAQIPAKCIMISNMGPMIERYRCPYCSGITEVALSRLLAEGETDLRGKIGERQKLKLDLPGRLLVTCDACGREFVITPVGAGDS